MATSRHFPCLQTERHHAGRHNHHEHGRKDHHRHRNAGGHTTPDEIARSAQQRSPKGEQGSGRDPTGAGLRHHQSTREADKHEGDARRFDPLAQKKGRAEDQNQRPRLENGYHIGNRHASKSHDIAEGAERLPGCPQQRAHVEESRNSAQAKLAAMPRRKSTSKGGRSSMTIFMKLSPTTKTAVAASIAVIPPRSEGFLRIGLWCARII